MKPQDAKLCKDCRFCPAGDPMFAKCGSPKSRHLDLVSGETGPLYCSTERFADHPDYCGLSGAWFEPIDGPEEPANELVRDHGQFGVGA